MRKTATTPPGTKAKPSPKQTRSPAGRIHPVIIYPFRQPDDYSDLQALYQLVRRLAADKDRYAHPITVLDRKTHYSMHGEQSVPRFPAEHPGALLGGAGRLGGGYLPDVVLRPGRGLRKGWRADVYWLIPGDFNYGTTVGQQVLSRLHDLPEIILELDQDLCIGEIATDHNNSKQLIDTYGTFALLYNWFPAEAQEIRQFTERPRSEFFALRHSFLGEALRQRWYPYEQTVVMLLQAVFGKKGISRFSVGQISDLPEGRESLASAMLQVERTERVLKAIWREHHQADPDWVEQYRLLATTSNQVRHTALIILHNLLS